MTDVFVVAAARTAIGSFGGSLKGVTPTALGEQVTRAAIAWPGLAAPDIGHVVFDQVVPTEPRDAYLARVAAINAEVPHEMPAMTVNRLCSSGLQTILSAAQSILLGDCDVALGGGAEMMSRARFLAPVMRWGRSMGDTMLVDALNGALTDPFGKVLMDITEVCREPLRH